MLGGLCNNANEVIRSQAQCTDALQKLGYQPLTDYWIGELSSIPSGCSVRSDGSNGPHFEKSLTGVGSGRDDLIPICIRADVLSGKFSFLVENDLMFRYSIILKEFYRS